MKKRCSKPSGKHNEYCVIHPRKAGWMVCCVDCDLISEGATKQAALDNWDMGRHVKKDEECYD